MDFKELISHPGILKALDEAGYTTPTPIQAQAIPLVLSGCDLRASAQTGTGKTAAFILPSLIRLTTPSPIQVKGPRILILVPTRELAMQVANEAVKYSKHLSQVKTVCIYGGAPYPIQNRELSRHYEILVATPGRLIDHINRGKINFSRLELLILDEADRMLDMGFIDAVEEIVAAIPKARQTLMFSATLKGSVLKLSQRLLNNPEEISVAHEHDKHENIEQRLHNVDNLDHKYRLLDDLLNDPTLHQAIVFTSTKRQADHLVDKLAKSGQQADVLHGGMKQGQRSRTIMQLRQGKTRILVATDVAARGIDIPAISHVINFDLPMSVEDYVHRIGRTGRAGAKGIALSFATPRDMQLVRRIERFTGQKIISQSTPNSNSSSSAPSRPRPTSHEYPPRRFQKAYRPSGSGQKDFRSGQRDFGRPSGSGQRDFRSSGPGQKDTGRSSGSGQRDFRSSGPGQKDFRPRRNVKPRG